MVFYSLGEISKRGGRGRGIPHPAPFLSCFYPIYPTKLSPHYVLLLALTRPREESDESISFIILAKYKRETGLELVLSHLEIAGAYLLLCIYHCWINDIYRTRLATSHSSRIPQILSTSEPSKPPQRSTKNKWTAQLTLFFWITPYQIWGDS